MQSALFTHNELELLESQVGNSSLMGITISNHIDQVDAYMRLPLEVPGHGEAGGYEHNRHKQNYKYMYMAGNLFSVTKEKKYASFVIELLSLYADKYLTFGFHVQKNTNPTGRLFHQILNEHCWLLFSSLAYSCVSNEMTDDQRGHVESQLFEPMLDMFTVKYGHDFDRIHNHGIWAVAAVGICGLVLGKREYLEKAVYGQDNNGTGGFLAQLSKLYSPAGYYIEGPYYHRYAIYPTCVFAEILHRHMPEIAIYEYKDGVIGRTVKALLATAYPNGKFPALNDASRSMGVTDAGVQVAVSVLSKHYGCDENIVGMAEIQGEVWLHSCGLALSDEHQKAKDNNAIVTPYWPSIELNEGAEGDKGAQGFMRLKGFDGDITQLNMNYGQHGMGHGHFDTLGITFFNRDQEVLNEYGFARWVNVEPKFGGRYLDENKSYARQTIAHNAVTIDQQTQNDFSVEKADSVHGIPHFFIDDAEDCIGISAYANDHYDNVGMQRSAFLLKDERFEAPLLVDLFRLKADANHTYDYSHQYTGQIVRTNFSYDTYSELEPLGSDNGYQHLWKLASGKAEDCALVSWLQGNAYYSWIGTSSNSNGEVIFTSVGAADPSFNLRDQSSFILRSQGETTLFASVLETHGYFNEEFEQSTNARGQVTGVKVIGHDDIGSVVEITTNNNVFTLMVSNQLDCTKETTHQVKFAGVEYNWTGFYSLDMSASEGDK
ncbi:heparinase II/III family protein [Marinomonas sp. C2222]|uniref:Heparinase II/III family protein n=1 Tax=Marinomonas sargassi TaxID=2984494 RepID=A0ABT2YQM8_9GAMM|nr:heparinase II/III family protein [Marinomonas sargassi]MCV2402182.1 heparinase II/III family protein [Marinomonas sargassi]